MKYSYKKGLKKGIVSAIIFAIPLMMLQFPEYAELTIGGLGVILVNYLKVKYSK